MNDIGELIAASPKTLVYKTIEKNNNEHIHFLFLYHRKLMTTFDFILFIMELYDKTDSRGTPLQSRVVNCFKIIIRHYHQELEMDEMLLIEDFVAFILNQNTDISKMYGWLLKHAIQFTKKGKRINIFGNSTPLKKSSKKTKSFRRSLRSSKYYGIMDVPALELARQITLLHYKYQAAILFKEFHSLDDRQLSVNIWLCGDYSDKISRWLLTLLLIPSPKTRNKLYSHIIRLCFNFLEIRNFAGALAVFNVIDSIYATRLKLAVSKSTSKKIKALKKLFSPEKNFSELRKEIDQSFTPLIYPLAIYLKDVYHVEEGCETVLYQKNDIKYYNVTKMEIFGELIMKFSKVRKGMYPYTPVKSVQNLILNSPNTTWEEIDFMSDLLKK
eukprot:TRINITY_DN2508_c1_g1_i2.p1 TRINITY_DN2508_c1_g1~~TRINITY_DN2508_c1_g1_i2.p1  ORF type:complete len:385 (+),score=60.90 TRINITY_DN2508_c1_g1_i2:267-1421(+)